MRGIPVSLGARRPVRFAVAALALVVTWLVLLGTVRALSVPDCRHQRPSSGRPGECGEVVQVIGKLMMTHGDPVHWTGNLRAQLLDEVADVEAAIVFFNRHNMEPPERQQMARRVTDKVRKFEPSAAAN